MAFGWCLKKISTLFVRFTFIPKTGMGLPKSGISFTCEHKAALVCITKTK